MKFTLPLASAAAALLLAAPAFSTETGQDNTDQSTAPATEAPAEANAETPADNAPAAIEIPPITAPASSSSEAAEEPEEEKRICRRVRTDMSSRRAERVCLTREGWREFNQRR